MNVIEMSMLKKVWDSAKVNRGITYSEDMSLSDTCCVTFSTYEIVVWKYRKCKWCFKIINNWHNKSFDEFKKDYKAVEWEEE